MVRAGGIEPPSEVSKTPILTVRIRPVVHEERFELSSREAVVSKTTVYTISPLMHKKSPVIAGA